MYGRHMKKAPRLLAIRGAAALILVLALSIFPFATVMANTVSANVIDGDQSYTFNMSSASLEDILAQAEERGMEPLGPLDVAPPRWWSAGAWSWLSPRLARKASWWPTWATP